MNIRTGGIIIGVCVLLLGAFLLWDEEKSVVAVKKEIVSSEQVQDVQSMIDDNKTAPISSTYKKVELNTTVAPEAKEVMTSEEFREAIKERKERIAQERGGEALERYYEKEEAKFEKERIKKEKKEAKKAYREASRTWREELRQAKRSTDHTRIAELQQNKPARPSFDDVSKD